MALSKDQIALFELVTEELDSLLDEPDLKIPADKVLRVNDEEVDGDPDNRDWIKKV